MARIVISNLHGRTLEVTDLSRTLLEHLQREFLDWMHACGARGRCTTCKVLILDGHEHLEALTPAEMLYREMGALGEDERLACQLKISGDITIRVPDENKLPHVHYSS